ncbi:MAG: hypothetical protein NZ473_06425 [Candidatus Kapabacteria bacterium]|nr:hypothetical protein [Candidatus Kapabacteria bacterium]MCS7169963.1 hypothetical protein [Candidatus Kapabacteria bacterium]MDW7996113.1 hypothetical protein [Bacteroidota bacterium]MDW8224468.1 hypothetical protein [Bacteroidota bacterium]
MKRFKRDRLVGAGYQKSVNWRGVSIARSRGITGYRMLPLTRVAVTRSPGPRGGHTVPISTYRRKR